LVTRFSLCWESNTVGTLVERLPRWGREFQLRISPRSSEPGTIREFTCRNCDIGSGLKPGRTVTIRSSDCEPSVALALEVVKDKAND
jgi:hypothetical protein